MILNMLHLNYNVVVMSVFTSVHMLLDPLKNSEPTMTNFVDFVLCFSLRFPRSESHVSIIHFNQPVCHVPAQKVESSG